MQTREILADAFERVRRVVHQAAEGADAEALVFRLDREANSLAWLVWHLSRIQDRHVSRIVDREQLWLSEGWHATFGMGADPDDTGQGHSSEQVAAVRPSDAALLLDYHDAVAARTSQYLQTVDSDELERLVDPSAEPPTTVGAQLVTVIVGSLQHAGQAAYVRGIVDRRR